MTRNFVIDDSLFADVSPEQNYLADRGVKVSTANLADIGMFGRCMAGAEGLVLGPTLLTSAHFDAAPSLRVIGRPGVGLDNIDLDEALDRGIGVINCPDYCTEEVATHALALILSLARRIAVSDRVARESWSEWSRVGAIRPLSALTVGIVGAGRSGALLTALIRPMVARVVYVDPKVPQLAGADQLSSIDDVIAVADIISLHLPVNDATRDILSRKRIERLRPGAAIINVARGGLIDEEALAEALESGSVTAALDVLATEPPVGVERILSAPNVIFTPHTAWLSQRSEATVRIDVLDAMLNYLDGTSPTSASVALDPRKCRATRPSPEPPRQEMPQ